MFRRLLSKYGLLKAAIITTLMVAATSLVVASIVNTLIGRQVTLQIFLVSFLVPSFVAFPFIYNHFSLLLKLIKSEQVLKKSEEALHKANEKLEERVEERTLELKKTYNQLLHTEKLATSGSIAASLAHEFGNPLYGIKGVLTSIAQLDNLPQESARMIPMALEECDRMSNLLKNLQDFNRPTSGEKTLTNLQQVIDDVLILSLQSLGRKNITVNKNYTNNPRPVMVITDQIKQVILNLISNSIHACDQGGMINIRTSADENNTVITIHDNGHGIKEDILPKIFDPFFTTKKIAMGTGLGLSVCYGIIQRHNGTMEATSRPGEGTTFTITLPTEDNEGKLNTNRGCN